MVVLVDTKYFGSKLQYARRHNGIKTSDAAKIFRISIKELRRYERGLEPIPEHILTCLFYRGFCMLKCQKNGKI